MLPNNNALTLYNTVNRNFNHQIKVFIKVCLLGDLGFYEFIKSLNNGLDLVKISWIIWLVLIFVVATQAFSGVF